MYANMAEIRQANKERGYCWFEPDTMFYFDSIIDSKVYKGKYFISSEQDSHSSVRKYTIRICNPDGNIDTVGEFQQYITIGAARTAVRLL